MACEFYSKQPSRPPYTHTSAKLTAHTLRRWLRNVLQVLTIFTFLLISLSLLPLWRCPHWLIRGLDFPRLQFAVMALLLLAAQCLLLDLDAVSSQALVVGTLFCLGWQAWWVLPYTRLWRTEVAAATSTERDRELCVITANVLTPNRNASALLQLVRTRQPDVLVTLESNQWWENELSALNGQMPYSVKCLLDNLYGMHGGMVGNNSVIP